VSGLEELSREELIALVLRLREANVALEERVRRLERLASRNSGNSSITPLSPGTIATLRTWLTEHTGTPEDPLFTTIRRGPMNRDALHQRLTLYATAAGTPCPSLASKNVTPHVPRHSAAIALPHAGNDITVIALWLGHESVTTTQIYLQADMTLKQQALDRTTPPTTQPGRYQPPDQLLTFLEAL
jgi:integrase